MTRRKPVSAARAARDYHGVEWVAVASLAVLLGLGAVRWLRADEPRDTPLAGADAAVVHTLGAPTGILAVLNPVNCALNAEDAAALNAAAAIPGFRVRVLLVAVPAHDSIIQRVRRDFDFSSDVILSAASTVNPQRLPALLRTPFLAVVVRGQLRHAAWGESLKSLSSWLPLLAGVTP